MATHHFASRPESRFEVMELRSELETYNDVNEKERDLLTLTLKVLDTILVKLDNLEDDPAFIFLNFTKETKAKLEDILQERSNVGRILYTNWKITPDNIADASVLSDDELQDYIRWRKEQPYGSDFKTYIEQKQRFIKLPQLLAQEIHVINGQLHESEMSKAIETLTSLEDDLNRVEDKNRELKEKYASLAWKFNMLKKFLQDLLRTLPRL